VLYAIDRRQAKLQGRRHIKLINAKVLRIIYIYFKTIDTKELREEIC